MLYIKKGLSSEEFTLNAVSCVHTGYLQCFANILDVSFCVYMHSHAEESLDNIRYTNKMWISKKLCFIII